MTLNHSQQPDSPSSKLLAISFSFPPLAYPRSVQVARLVKHLRFETVMVCADEKRARLDPTIESDVESHLRACLRVPFSIEGWRKQADRIFSRLNPPLWNKIPDQYSSWKLAALKAVREFAQSNLYRPDIIVSFGQPMSDHLIGLELKKLYNAPWVAHFSDPWVDNLFHQHDALTRKVNLRLEQKVIQTADRLIFTSEETIDLIMAKYPDAYRAKARVIPHSFETSLYPPLSKNQQAGLIVRYIGEFYGKRTPQPLVNTLRSVLSTNSQLLEQVRFELIGPVNPQALIDSGLESLPEGLVITKPSVNYQESLELAASADGLLIVDAPAKKSVFLPSKLIDYIGAGRPILGLTPPGAAARVIQQLGGWVADPEDLAAMKLAMEAFLFHLSQSRNELPQVWGEPETRMNYEASRVADSFESILCELVA
jgi:glycosyltransferase involved in cell wall biosynthesis